MGIAFLGNAQESFREKFTEGNYLMGDHLHNLALPIWKDLLKEQPDNFNINYKIGVCYLHMPDHKSKAKNFLVKAAQGITKNYDPIAHTMKKAPVEARFYLGRAYHLNNELDKATEEFNKFLESVTDKHYLHLGAKRSIEMCAYAKEAMAKPVKIKISNIGAPINSAFADYSPVISIDENVIYFTSRRLRADSSNLYTKDDESGGFFEDIYASFKDDDGKWSEPELLKNINTDGHEATINLSADGQSLFIYKDDNGDGNLYVSTLDGNEWSAPVKLGSDICGEKSQETHVDISADGNILYFISDRKAGGVGGKDIWYCKKLPNGEWALAQNLGPEINTIDDEDGVYMHPDGKTMYFSSRGHTSMGGYDLFYSEWDDLNQKWGKPKNMGYPINSTDDDVFLVTTPDGRRAYYSAFHDEEGVGEKDIYMLDLEGGKEKNLTLLVGRMKVLDMDDLPDNARIVVTDNNTGETVGIYKPRKRDGKYSIILYPGNDYHFLYEAGEYSYEEDIYIPAGSGYQVLDRGIDLKPVVFGERPTEGNKKPLANNDTYETDINKSIKDNVTYNDSDPDGDKLKVTTKLLVKPQHGTVRISSVGDFTYSPKRGYKGQDMFVYEVCDDYKKSPLCSKANVTIFIGESASMANNNNQNNNNQNNNNQNNNNNNQNNNNQNNNNQNNVVTGPTTYDYVRYFGYNKNAVTAKEAAFKSMVEACKNAVKKNGFVTISVEASASRVPTRTYKTNDALSKKRGQNAKDYLVKVLKQKGIKDNQIKIASLSSKVQGPVYKDDWKENRVEYEKYQYVKINVK